MRLLWVFALLMIGACCFAYADSEIPRFAKVDKPIEGSCYIKQIPASIAGGIENHLVIAYKILLDGSDEMLWRSSGWYAHEVFLTSDCKYLIRMGNWSRGQEPSAEDLAVAFYVDGELLKAYSTVELIQDKESVDRSIGHYLWQSKDTDYPYLKGWGETFYLKTIEDKVFEFNFKTGEIKNH